MVQGSPTKWTKADGELITEAIHEGPRSPVARPYDPRKLRRPRDEGQASRPRRAAPVRTGPEASPLRYGRDRAHGREPSRSPTRRAPHEARLHSRVEYLLLRLGSDMGLQLWIDPVDRNLVVDGVRLGDIPGVMEESLPQFRKESRLRGPRIDVLWLRDDEVIAAFEVESTTAVYSGLLRMADLLALQPNINILLFIVAEERRRKDVIRRIGARPSAER